MSVNLDAGNDESLNKLIVNINAKILRFAIDNAILSYPFIAFNVIENNGKQRKSLISGKSTVREQVNDDFVETTSLITAYLSSNLVRMLGFDTADDTVQQQARGEPIIGLRTPDLRLCPLSQLDNRNRHKQQLWLL